jgi:cell division protein FtsL
MELFCKIMFFVVLFALVYLIFICIAINTTYYDYAVEIQQQSVEIQRQSAEIQQQAAEIQKLQKENLFLRMINNNLEVENAAIRKQLEFFIDKLDETCELLEL